MAQRVHTWVFSGVLALAALAPASAQIVPSLGGPDIRDFSGIITPSPRLGFQNFGAIVTPSGTVPPRIPSTVITPNYVFHYGLPQAVYVPVFVTPPRPAVEPVTVATVTLRGGTAPADVRVGRGTVVTWENTADRERTLIVPSAPSPSDGGAETNRWRIRENGRVSLVFRRPGTYEYYLQDRPEERARIIVEE